MRSILLLILSTLFVIAATLGAEEKTDGLTHEMKEACSAILYMHSCRADRVKSITVLGKTASDDEIRKILAGYLLKKPESEVKSLRVLEYKMDEARSFTVKYQLDDSLYLGKGNEEYAGENRWVLILTQAALLSVMVDGKVVKP